ncbi:SWIM zinc finger family protein [Undibacterium baiyunense]|uniref:SWIM zinc finger family protein n=1 Tax=Undibacterium baiyunense TaxID=2828731 RepID=A0A941DJQ4_9BURK|nr:SWIM zinc finger family protein [Undibacterium baiyunense]
MHKACCNKQYCSCDLADLRRIPCIHLLAP